MTGKLWAMLALLGIAGSAAARQPVKKPAPAKTSAPTVTALARVTKVDLKTRRVTAEVETEEGKVQRTGTVAKAARIRKAGKTVGLAALKAGDVVQVKARQTKTGYEVLSITAP